MTIPVTLRLTETVCRKEPDPESGARAAFGATGSTASFERGWRNAAWRCFPAEAWTAFSAAVRTDRFPV